MADLKDGAAEFKELDAHSKHVVRELLQDFDVDGNGIIDGDELANVLRSVGIFPTQDDIDFFLKVFDKNGDGHLQIEELLDNWATVLRHSVSGDDIMAAFVIIDQDRDGYIRLGELLKVLTTAGKEPMSGEEAARLMQELMVFDRDYDGKFSYSEFFNILMERKLDLTGARDYVTDKALHRHKKNKSRKKRKHKNIEESCDINGKEKLPECNSTEQKPSVLKKSQDEADPINVSETMDVKEI